MCITHVSMYMCVCTHVTHIHIPLALNIYLNIQFLFAFWSLFSPVFLDGMADKISIRLR